MSNTKKSASTMMAMAAALLWTTGAVADQCNAILGDGVFDSKSSSRNVVMENTAKRHICTHRGQDLSDGKALEVGFMIRFLGIRIGVGKDQVKSWIDANCTDNSTFDRTETKEIFSSRSADKAITEAWLRCKTLQFKASGVGITDEVRANDRSGRPYRFRIAILGQSYYWDRASTTLVMHKRRPFDIQAQLQSKDWGEALMLAKDVFAVGTASCGGAKEKEVERALARANRLRDWINASSASGSGTSRANGTINLGKYEDEYCVEGSAISDMQRPILVLLVIERPGQALRAIDYQTALLDAATSHPVFQFDRYSNFDIAIR